MACGSPKLHDTHNEKVSVTWDDITLHRTHLKNGESMPPSAGGDQTVAFMEDNSFCFNTGAMSHILLIKVDYMDMKPIAPRSMQGVNGISILAIGIGLVKVRCGKGRKITLRDVLYVLYATLHLISVG